MPELPEVETVRRGLERMVVGRGIHAVEVGRERVVRRTSRDALIDAMTGSTFTGASRRGKYLVLHLDSGLAAMVHLRMSGQVLLADADLPRPTHTHVVWHLDDGSELRFVDPRTFGEVVVFDPDEIDRDLPEFARLGPDPIADEFDAAVLRSAIGHRRRRLKALLLDQSVIAGIGNIYADEILHRARLHPDRLGVNLSAAQMRRLADAIVAVLAEAIAAGGSSLRDAQYVDLLGGVGAYQETHRVYGRAGELCLTCGRSRIVRRSDGARGTHFCPNCQRRPSPPPSTQVAARSTSPSGGLARDRGAAGPTR